MVNKYQDAGKERKNYTLDTGVVKLIEHFTMIEGHKNMSNFMEHLVYKHDAENNPARQLKKLDSQEASLKDKIKEIEEKKAEIIKKMEMKAEASEIMKQDKERCINLMIRKIKEGSTIWELQNYIKTWSYRLGISHEELSFAIAMRMKQENVRVNQAETEVVDKKPYGDTHVF